MWEKYESRERNSRGAESIEDWANHEKGNFGPSLLVGQRR